MQSGWITKSLKNKGAITGNLNKYEAQSGFEREDLCCFRCNKAVEKAKLRCLSSVMDYSLRLGRRSRRREEEPSPSFFTLFLPSFTLASTIYLNLHTRATIHTSFIYIKYKSQYPILFISSQIGLLHFTFISVLYTLIGEKTSKIYHKGDHRINAVPLFYHRQSAVITTQLLWCPYIISDQYWSA